jgi:hypothetical protein
MKQFFKTPMVSLIMLILSSAAYICIKWESPRVVFMIPSFLFFLLFFVVVLRLRLRKRNQDTTVVNQAKAANVS